MQHAPGVFSGTFSYRGCPHRLQPQVCARGPALPCGCRVLSSSPRHSLKKPGLLEPGTETTAGRAAPAGGLLLSGTERAQGTEPVSRWADIL